MLSSHKHILTDKKYENYQLLVQFKDHLLVHTQKILESIIITIWERTVLLNKNMIVLANMFF